MYCYFVNKINMSHFFMSTNIGLLSALWWGCLFDTFPISILNFKTKKGYVKNCVIIVRIIFQNNLSTCERVAKDTKGAFKLTSVTKLLKCTDTTSYVFSKW